jgi:hypothetical protein
VRMGMHTGEPVLATEAPSASMSIVRRGSGRRRTAVRYWSRSRRGR